MRGKGLLAVSLVALASSVLAQTEPEGQLPVSVHRADEAGAPFTIWYLFYLQPGCRASQRPALEILTPPKHGTVQALDVERSPAYPPDNPLAACNGPESPMTGITYTPETAYVAGWIETAE